MFPSMTSNGYGLFIPQPQPRSLEGLHAERVYLLSSLQQENVKAADLLRKLSPLEELLVLSDLAHVRRRARKQVGWLRYRINETTRQERTILNSLGQLAQEIQSRERWNQVEHEQRQRGQALNDHVNLCQQMLQLRFTPISPQYQLHEFPFPYVQTPPQQQCEAGGFPRQQSVFDYTADMPSEIFSPLSVQGNQCLAENLGFNTQAKDLVVVTLHRRTRSPSMNVLDVELMKTDTPPAPISDFKRHSTGGRGLPTIWSNKEEVKIDSKEESLEGSQYSGFYINR